jgi:hypothetical protein
MQIRLLEQTPNSLPIHISGEDKKAVVDILIAAIERGEVSEYKRDSAFDIIVFHKSDLCRIAVFKDGVFQLESGGQFKIDDTSYASLLQLASKYVPAASRPE